MKTLTKVNYGKPTNPKIFINPKNASKIEPQSWEHEGNWYYNWQGAMDEAEFTGNKLPTIEELMEFLKDENIQKSIQYAGFRNAGNGEFYSAGDCAGLWSSSPEGDGLAHCAFLERGNADAYRGWNGRGRGMLLRFLSESDSSDSLSLPDILEINGVKYKKINS